MWNIFSKNSNGIQIRVLHGMEATDYQFARKDYSVMKFANGSEMVDGVVLIERNQRIPKIQIGQGFHAKNLPSFINEIGVEI